MMKLILRQPMRRQRCLQTGNRRRNSRPPAHQNQQGIQQGRDCPIFLKKYGTSHGCHLTEQIGQIFCIGKIYIDSFFLPLEKNLQA
nr:unnamed protein product [Callosobruchus chinensis]